MYFNLHEGTTMSTSKIIGTIRYERMCNQYEANVFANVFGDMEETVICAKSIRLLKRAIKAHIVDNEHECLWHLFPKSYLRAHKRVNPHYVTEYHLPYNSL